MNLSKRRKIAGFFTLPILIIFTLIAAVMLIFTIKSAISNPVPDGYAGAEAVITSITGDLSEDSTEIPQVDIKYTYGGAEYTGTLDYYSSTMSEGSTIKIFVDPNDPASFRTSGIGRWLFILIPALLTALGLYLIFNKIRHVSPEKHVNAILNSASPALLTYNFDTSLDDEEKKYNFYVCGKLNQSFAMNDGENIIYEGNLTNFSMVGDSDYDFVNKLTGTTTSHKIGKTVSGGTEHVVTDSSFDFDGVDVLEYFSAKGLNFTMKKLHLINPEFALTCGDSTIAHYRLHVQMPMVDNVMGIGKKMVGTVITTRSANTDLVFLGAVVLERIDISALI